MSGVAKDETTPTSVDDEAVADNAEVEAVVETPVAAEPTFPPLFAPKDTAEADSPARSRRVAPHLRVVTENDPAALAEPAMRVGPMMRAERERQNLTLEQVSRETRVTVSHLKAIEDMTPNLIGEAVYVKGHIRTYARHLKLDPDDTVTRYLRESAILADPEKQEIAPPATARKLPMALPVLGMVIVALLAGGAVYFAVRGTGSSAPTQSAQGPSTALATAPEVEATGPAITATSGPVLRLVALKRARIEVRGADGTPYRKRFFSPGESYSPRVGAGWTVTTNDGAAFEWRLGDASLGLLAPEGGPVYAQSVDLALAREPLVDPDAPVDTSASDLEANVPAAVPASGAAAPAKPKPKPVAPKPAVTSAPTAAPPKPTPSADEANQAAPVDPFAAN